MISAVRTIKPQRGFTLIEIVMVLAISAVVMGGAVGFMISSSDERALRNASGEIELLAKKARVSAILHQTSYALEFREGIVRLLPLAQAGIIQKKNSRTLPPVSAPELNEASGKNQVNLSGDMALFIRHWNADAWLPTTKNAVRVWRFDPDGLCEPISIRLSLPKSWSEDSYHPLTATIRESSLEAR